MGRLAVLEKNYFGQTPSWKKVQEPRTRNVGTRFDDRKLLCLDVISNFVDRMRISTLNNHSSHSEGAKSVNELRRNQWLSTDSKIQERTAQGQLCWMKVKFVIRAVQYQKKKWGRRRPNTSMFVLMCPTVVEIQGFEISRNPPPPLILRKHCHDCAIQRRLDSQQ